MKFAFEETTIGFFFIMLSLIIIENTIYPSSSFSKYQERDLTISNTGILISKSYNT